MDGHWEYELDSGQMVHLLFFGDGSAGQDGDTSFKHQGFCYKLAWVFVSWHHNVILKTDDLFFSSEENLFCDWEYEESVLKLFNDYVRIFFLFIAK